MSRFECPHCGADVNAGAIACRECGSDMATGWGDEEAGIELPEDYGEREYADFLASEFPQFAPTKALIKRRFGVWVLAILVLSLLVWVLRRF